MHRVACIWIPRSIIRAEGGRLCEIDAGSCGVAPLVWLRWQPLEVMRKRAAGWRLADVCARPAGTKFSPLKQIHGRQRRPSCSPPGTCTLVERPAVARARPRRGRPEIPSNPEVSPIVVNGVMYLLSAGNTVMALDAATGKPIWQHKLHGDFHRPRRRVLAWRSQQP